MIGQQEHEKYTTYGIFQRRKISVAQEENTRYQRLTYFQWRNYGPTVPAAAGPGKGWLIFEPKKLEYMWPNK